MYIYNKFTNGDNLTRSKKSDYKSKFTKSNISTLELKTELGKIIN